MNKERTMEAKAIIKQVIDGALARGFFAKLDDMPVIVGSVNHIDDLYNELEQAYRDLSQARSEILDLKIRIADLKLNTDGIGLPESTESTQGDTQQ